MLCVLFGGTFSALQTGGLFKKSTPEPLQSQNTMQVGLAWMLSSIVPFWRGHSAIGILALLIGVVTFVQGCLHAYGYGKKQARAARLIKKERLPSHAANDDTLDQNAQCLTGKAAYKQRRRAARKAACKNHTDLSNPQPTSPHQPEPQ